MATKAKTITPGLDLLDLGGMDIWPNTNYRNMVRRARRAFRSGNIKNFMDCWNHEDYMEAWYQNIEALRGRDLLPEALAYAYVYCKHNTARFQPYMLYFFFSYGGLDRIRACGDPVPCALPVTVYRGVCGKKPKRNVLGIAWTRSLDAACWFALRYAKRLGNDADPAVYTATMHDNDLLFYTNKRHEDEFVGIPARCRRRAIPLDEMQKRFENHVKAIR